MRTYIIVLALSLISAGATAQRSKYYWEGKIRGGLEPYTNMIMGWPSSLSCRTFDHTRMPTSHDTVRRMTFHRQVQRSMPRPRKSRLTLRNARGW